MARAIAAEKAARMRWCWIDRFTEFHSGRYAKAWYTLKQPLFRTLWRDVLEAAE